METRLAVEQSPSRAKRTPETDRAASTARTDAARCDAPRAYRRPPSPPPDEPLAGVLARAVSQRADVAVLARTTTIADDVSDPANLLSPGSGRGVHVEHRLTPQQSVHPTIKYGPLRNECGTWMHADVLLDQDDLGGSEPKTGTWPSWWATHGPSNTNYWVRGHLLNHNLGGPGERRNLTPITKKCNSQHHALVESLCKTASDNGWHIDYWVDVLYDATGPKLKATPNNPDPVVWPHLATHFQCQFQFREPENGAVTGGGAKKLFIENTHDN